jgi:hypothetical protein
MARHPPAALALLVSLALLHLASAARVLHQDAAAPAPAAEPAKLAPVVVGEGIFSYGMAFTHKACDLSVEEAWSTSNCTLEDDGSKPLSLPMGEGKLAKRA